MEMIFSLPNKMLIDLQTPTFTNPSLIDKKTPALLNLHAPMSDSFPPMHSYQMTAFFAGSFDTFKVFEGLKVQNLISEFEFPATIWQVLNHLIGWQKWQLAQLTDNVPVSHFDESGSWIDEKLPASQHVLDQAVNLFDKQISEIKEAIAQLKDDEETSFQQWKIIQDVSLHLSFHLGEVVLMRRLMKDYPLPHQMKEFLK
jgi:hypothetical protein